MRLIAVLVACLLLTPALADPKDLARYTRRVERGDVDGVEPLALLFPGSAAAVLGRALGQRDVAMRRAASSALWDLAGKDEHRESVRAASAALESALGDPDATVAMNAAGALQALGREPAELADARRRVLQAEAASLSARFLAARGLIGIEPASEVLPALLDYLFDRVPDHNDGRPSSASSALGQRLAHQAIERQVKQDPAGSLPFLLHAMDSAHPAVPSLLALAHPARAGIEDWPERLLFFTRSTHPGTRTRAWALLGELAEPELAARWVPEAARQLREGGPAERIVAALSAQAGASSAANEALAELAVDAAGGMEQRLAALDALQRAASDVHSRADAAGKVSAQGAGLRAAGALLASPDIEARQVNGVLFAVRDFAPDGAARAGWYAQRAAESRGAIQLALIEAVGMIGSEARDSLDVLRGLLDGAEPALREQLVETLNRVDPAWQARERRAATPLPPEQRVVQAPGQPAFDVERGPAAPAGRSGGSFPRFYEAIRAGNLKAFQAELDAGLAINQAHQLAPVAQFRITPLQAVVDYCHITELVSTETLVAMARLLLQRGADPGLTGSRDRSALESAFDSQCPEPLREVLQGG